MFRTPLVGMFAKVSGDEGEVGILHGATLVNPASASMAWFASVAVGCGGTVQNNGTLTFTGSVSMVATEDTDGFVASTAVDGMDVIWPVLLNDEGGELIVDDGAEVALEWLLWNQGGDILVGSCGRFCRRVQRCDTSSSHARINTFPMGCEGLLTRVVLSFREAGLLI